MSVERCSRFSVACWAVFWSPFALADPTIDFYRGSQLILSNDNWKSDHASGIEATGIPSTNDKESAILVTFDPGSYTAVIRGKNNTTGVGLVEVFRLR